MQLNEALVAKIAQIAIFRGMPRQCLINTLNCADSWPIKQGDTFFHEGDRGQSFFILLAGEVSVTKRSGATEVTLATLKPGQCFGEMALVDGKPRSATVKANQNCISLRFSREKLEGYPEASTFVYRNIAKVLVQRLAESNDTNVRLAAQVATMGGEKALAEPAAPPKRVVVSK